MIKDDQWPIARLIPITSASGVEAQERRATSALLAVIAAVPEFGRSLLKPLGAPAGRVESFIEIPFKLGERSIRPDGIITVSRAGKFWGAIVETKVGQSPLEAAQMDTYLDLARDLKFEAVLSISNQYVTSSSDYPIEVDRRKARRLTLHHWSWIEILTEAEVQRKHRGVSDPDQAFILTELIRYLRDPRSGAVALDSMGPSWTKVRDGARDRTLRKGDSDVAAVAARWDDLVRYLGLELTTDLGRGVKQSLPSQEATPALRQQALRAALSESGRLYADLSIPNAAGPMRIVADLSARQVMASTRMEAPKNARTKGRISWLLRQLQHAPETLKVEVAVARSRDTLASTLGEIREDPSRLYPGADREIKHFVLTMTRNMGLKRDATRGSFIRTVLDSAREFYGDVLQHLRVWKSPPPKLERSEEPEAIEAAAATSPQVEEAVEEGVEEMKRVAKDPSSIPQPSE